MINALGSRAPGGKHEVTATRMTRLGVGLVVVTLVFAGPFAALPRSAHAQESDPWFGRDKALHFTATASIAVVGYGASAMLTDHRPTRVTAAATLAMGAGIGKELWDLAGSGDASWKDLTWDLVGTATGVLVASAVDWMIRRW